MDLLLDEKHSRIQLEQQVQELRDELSTQKLAFDQQRNKTLAELDAFQRAFLKEKSNRFNLEQVYTRLMIDFHNLSMEHTALKKFNTNLETEVQNLSESNNSLYKYVQNISAKHDALAKLNTALTEKVNNLSVESTENKQTFANVIDVLNQTSIASFNILRTDLDLAKRKADIVTIRANMADLTQKQGNYLLT